MVKRGYRYVGPSIHVHLWKSTCGFFSSTAIIPSDSATRSNTGAWAVRRAPRNMGLETGDFDDTAILLRLPLHQDPE
ncbi:uncharacterized protein ColSpa_10653 [Colletotrichum spaethianum]|uniref:Uncharacterized protein n=1 Tax=Colletotrichum spaethianum TaxID=700344 RepID=A0AA37PE35_9PEZI|nr:uncharacterized protein ColSpa_10653 [Colletotrichum spaethianum]GKT50472.1 hypothetical protein ColSpa_10653 [Colletotrichum spaethianum]